MEHTKTGLVSFADMKAGSIIIETLLDQEIGAYLKSGLTCLFRRRYAGRT